MSDESTMYDRAVQAHQTLGARRCTREGAAAPRAKSRCLAITQADCRESLRHVQRMDGVDSFLNENSSPSQYGDEPPCVGLQLQTTDTNSRNWASHRGGAD